MGQYVDRTWLASECAIYPNDFKPFIICAKDTRNYFFFEPDKTMVTWDWTLRIGIYAIPHNALLTVRCNVVPSKGGARDSDVNPAGIDLLSGGTVPRYLTSERLRDLISRSELREHCVSFDCEPCAAAVRRMHASARARS